MTNCSEQTALPVEPFLRRMECYADEIAAHHLPPATPPPAPDAVVAAVAHFIYDVKGFRVAASPAIRRGDVLEHPGVGRCRLTPS
jgi:hypothetical protein